MRKVAKRILLGVGGIIVLTVASVLVPFVYVRSGCRQATDVAAPATTMAQSPPAEITDYARAEESTYLTFPEWYIVYSADEYATFLKDHRPSQFPYFSAIGQYWYSYSCVWRLTRDHYPHNSENHTVLSVIGGSFTIENLLKGGYEKTFGRVSELLSLGRAVEEDMYAQHVAEEYGTFLHTIPWYEFPFTEKLRGLWTDTSFWGAWPLRKWERKLSLTAEYGTKAIYGALIKQATRATFVPPDLEIYVRSAPVPTAVLEAAPTVRVVQSSDATQRILLVPRYEAFTQIMLPMLRSGVRVLDIAGNDEVLLTVLAPRDWQVAPEQGEWLFSMDVLTQEDQKRVALRVPVTNLHDLIPSLEKDGVHIEHMYDY